MTEHSLAQNRSGGGISFVDLLAEIYQALFQDAVQRLRSV